MQPDPNPENWRVRVLWMECYGAHFAEVIGSRDCGALGATQHIAVTAAVMLARQKNNLDTTEHVEYLHCIGAVWCESQRDGKVITADEVKAKFAR